MSTKQHLLSTTATNTLVTTSQVTCHECGFILKVPILGDKQKALCPRCGYTIATFHNNALQWVGALAISALVFLIASLPFEFLSFSAGGQTQKIDIIDSIGVLFNQDYAALGLIEAIAILILPASILVTIMLLVIPLQFGLIMPKAAKIVDLLFALLPWAMAEIFLIGVLVSLVKISSLAEVAIGPSFYAFALFTITMTAMLVFLDEHQLRIAINDNGLKPNKPLNPSQSIQTTWALLLTAVVLYVPANFLPIMVTNTLGNQQPSTIIGGVILLWRSGSYPIALIIFIASVVVPVAKIIILCWLNYSVQQGHQQLNRQRMHWYRLTEFIGRWSMIDVFVVAVLVSLIQLGNVMSIQPGHAALAFCGVVIMTMLAAMSFDTRLIWVKESTSHE